MACLAELRIAVLQVAAQRTPANEPLEAVMINAHSLFHFVGLPCGINKELEILLYSKPEGNA